MKKSNEKARFSFSRSLLRGALTATLPGLFGALAACSSGAESLSNETVATESDALCSGSGACTATTATGHLGTWPSGQIKYELVGTTSFKSMVRQAMDDWENVADHIIRFVPATSGTRVQISLGTSGGSAPGFDSCSGACSASMSSSNVYHELGHIIGFKHEFQRYDRRHYEIVNTMQHDGSGGMTPTACSDASNVARTSNGTTMGMLGPFDFKSTMQYAVTHPDFTRFDGTPIVAGAQCDTVGTLPLPPQCSNDDCTGANCNGALGVCATCASCGKRQPNGFPSKGDGAAVVEMYQSAFNSRWKVYTRAVNEVTSGAGASQPFDYTLNGTATINANRTLDASPYPSGGIDIHVTGSDNHVWEKYKSAGAASFTAWTDLGAVPGSGTVSDPSSVAWGNDRLDVVVRRGSTLYIKTWTSATDFGAWQSLGSPASTPASSPAIASWGANRLDVFVRGADDQLYWKKCTASCSGNSGTWSGWSAIPGGTFRGKPTAVGREPGVIDVFVHGTDDTLWGVENINDTWYGFYQANAGGTLKWDPSCPDCSSPAVTSRGAGKLDVMIRGTDDQMWITSWQSGAASWTGYNAMGGVLTSSPTGSGKARVSDRIDTFAVMAEERQAGTTVYGPWWKQYTE